MSKKILVIDLDKLEERMAKMQRIEIGARLVFINTLLKSQADVIEFQAEVHKSSDNKPYDPFIFLPEEFEDGDILRGFVVKKGKQ